MRMAASPAQSFLFTVHVCERVSFAPPDWTYTSSQQPFPASHVKLYYISGRRRFSGAVTLRSKSVCLVLDTLYRQSCGKQLCCNLRSTVRVLTLSLSSLLFVLLLFHSLPSISISITVWQYLSFLERISSPPWGQCDEVKNFHTRVEILSGPIRDMAPHMHQEPKGTDLMRTPELVPITSFSQCLHSANIQWLHQPYWGCTETLISDPRSV